MLPRIISVDDHVVEPPTLWSDRLPAKARERGPRVVRVHGNVVVTPEGYRVEEGDGPRARWCDVWHYDGDVVHISLVALANVGPARDQKRQGQEPMTYDEMLPGCYDQSARLRDMDANHTEASMCFPTVSRFCGQTFLERRDHDFALECLRIYNDWMIDEWCGGAGRGRLIPLTLVPLWDPELAAEEVRRCAGKGSHSITFAEGTDSLGLPSIYSGAWAPLLHACEETDTVINMHIGSSSSLPTTQRAAPVSAKAAITFQNAMHALVDWVLSGLLATHPGLRIVLTEGQGGWLPFIMERLDEVWQRAEMYEYDMRSRLPEPPTVLMKGRVFTCIFNDEHALRSRDIIGMEHLLFETDYPHSDSTFPHSKQVAEKLTQGAGLSSHETWQFVRGNAIGCFGLDRFGISS